MHFDTGEARLTIDLGALAANYAVLLAQAGEAEVAPVVKADAYGLGAGPVVCRLWAEGARSFFVARVREGVELRRVLGPERPATIYVLDGCPDGAGPRLAAAGLTPTLSSLEQIATWAREASAQRRSLACAIHVDTGMNRLGLRPEEAEAVVSARDRLGGLEVELLVTHLACAELPDHPLNALQLDRFARLRAVFPGVRASLANSAASFRGEPFRAELIRPGISLYGGGPFGRPDARLATVATLHAPVLQVRSVRPGESIGYDAAFTAQSSLKVAVIAAGYADGVLRSAQPRGYGWLHGAPRPFLGRISMDLIALDVSGCDARPGDPVELLGPNVPLDDVAERSGTIAYEVLTRLAPRLSRTYVGAAG